MDAKNTASTFSLFILGQIESATFELGTNLSNLICHYEFRAGVDWTVVSGHRFGLTQAATTDNKKFNEKIVFNMPIELMYKSSSIFGWPQMIISIFGKNCWGTDTVLGYCRVLIPVLGTNQASSFSTESSINVPIITPKPTSMISDIESWITRRNVELKDPTILVNNSSSKGLFVESYGSMQLNVRTIAKDAKKFDYEWTP